MEFAKIYERILRSSVWLEDDSTLRVWITLLVLSDKDGDVMTSPPRPRQSQRPSRGDQVRDCRSRKPAPFGILPRLYEWEG